MYGIYNVMKKEFQFGISETSKTKAVEKLFAKIGKDAYKWRFEVKKIKETSNAKQLNVNGEHIKHLQAESEGK